MTGLLWGRANVRSGYCPVERMSGRANVYRASVRGLLSSQVTVQSGYCLVGLLSGRVTVFQVSVHRAAVCRACVLGEVSVGLVSGRAIVRLMTGTRKFVKVTVLIFKEWHIFGHKNAKILKFHKSILNFSEILCDDRHSKESKSNLFHSSGQFR